MRNEFVMKVSGKLWRAQWTKRFMTFLFAMGISVNVLAQQDGDVTRAAPRWEDGRINLGAPVGESGLWYRGENYLAINPDSYEPDATRNSRIHIDDIPLKPWARALMKYRNSLYLGTEPYTRCQPSGGARHFIAFYGMEMMHRPELQRVYQFFRAISGSYRVIYLDQSEHPENLTPSYFGHSIGQWEGDTLVVDTVGMNEKFWMNREGMPHTTQLHLIERITRTSFDTMDYTVTVDDPGAYDAPWTSGFTLRWHPDEQITEYICQENNRSPEGMFRYTQSRIVP